jgi:hypothetical protein
MSATALGLASPTLFPTDSTQVVIVDSVLYCDAVGADYIEGVR